MTTTTSQSRTAERETFLADIITTAVEGGIGYWCTTTVYRWYSPDLDGGSADPGPNGGGNAYARIVPMDDIDAVYEITPDRIDQALTKIASGQEIKYLGSVTRSTVLAANATNEPFPEGVCGIDSDVADEIVQVAIFGEVVYG